MRKIYLLAILVMLIRPVIAQTTSLRGLYINQFDNILGNTVKEDSLLQYALDSSFNYMALYDLGSFNLHNAATANMLASFIKRARENYGVQYIGAVEESYSGFRDDIAPYNDNRSDDNERFNVFNLEFEFWTTSSVNSGGYYCTKYLQQANCSCDTSGGFKFFIKQMHQIDSLAAVQHTISETYLGWFNQGQASQIQQNVDRILLHAYRTGTSSLYSYSKARLQYLASNNSMTDIAPIFSSEPSFMGPWLTSNSQEAAYDQYKTDFDNDNGTWKQYINVLGYQWFDWGFMPKPAAGTFSPTITASGSLSFCSGDSVILTATSGDSYSWLSGQTTRSITVKNAGSYSCNVTLGSVTHQTPSKTTTVFNSPAVTISQGNFSGGQVLLSSAATPGSGTISSYQWKINNTDIGGAATSTFSVVSSGDFALEVTNSNGCNKISNTLSVSITGCSASTPTGLTSTGVTSNSELLSWDQGLSGDSIIIKYQPASGGNNYSYIRMENVGQSQKLLSGLQTSTTYNWQMYFVCGNTEGTYSTLRTFTTGNLSGISPVPNQEYDSFINSYKAYPNPANDKIQVEFNSASSGKYEISLSDLNARKVFSELLNINEGLNKYSFNISGFGNGIYFLSLVSDRNVSVKKIIIEH